jgi:hypothetical protein
LFLFHHLQVEESVSMSNSAVTATKELVNGQVVSSQESAERLASEHVASSTKHGDQVCKVGFRTRGFLNQGW